MAVDKASLNNSEAVQGATVAAPQLESTANDTKSGTERGSSEPESKSSYDGQRRRFDFGRSRGDWNATETSHLTLDGLSGTSSKPTVARTNRSEPLAGGPDINDGYVGIDPRTFPLFNQFDVDPKSRNACGTTVEAMILAHHGLIPNRLEEARKVDQYVRGWDGFSAPDDLISYARSKGLHGVPLNQCSIDEMRARIAAGNSVMALIDGFGMPHWVAILGFHDAADGSLRVVYADPASGFSKQDMKEMTAEQRSNVSFNDLGPGREQVTFRDGADFKLGWKKPNQILFSGFANDLLGQSNFIIAFDQNRKALPPRRELSVAATNTMADGITDVANSVPHLFHGRLLSAVGGLLAGPVKMVSALPGAIGRLIEVPGSIMLISGSALRHQGRRGLGVLVLIAGGLLKGIGWPIRVVGNVVAHVGHYLGGALQWMFEAPERLIGKALRG